jgi:hypothetical protein
MTMMPADPRNDPACCTESKSIATSIWSGVNTGIEAPPGITALSVRPFAMPPACSKMISRSGVPIGSSYTPGRRTCPLTQ